VVGPSEGSKPRQMLITKEQWQEMQLSGNPFGVGGCASSPADPEEPDPTGEN